MDAVLSWFDLSAEGGSFGIVAESGIPLAQQLLLYGIVVAGVIMSEGVAMARRGEAIRIDLSPPWLVTASIIALVVFPAVWRELGVTNASSLLVQAGLAAQGGVFWGVLLAGAEKRSAADEGT